jgi:hypothetical protein
MTTPKPRKRKPIGTWFGIYHVTGDEVSFPALSRTDGYHVRNLTAAELTKRLGYEVKPEWVMPHWAEGVKS